METQLPPAWEDFSVPPTEGRYGIQLTKNGRKAIIEQDTFGDSPREWDNLGTLAAFHRQYDLGDKLEDRFKEMPPAEIPALLEKEGAIVLPVYLLDHSGLRISTSDFHDSWDSGQVGFIYATKEKILAEFGEKELTDELKEKAAQILKNEIKTLDQYLSGDVYSVQIVDEGGNVLDAVSGFYGIDYAKQEAIEMLEAN